MNTPFAKIVVPIDFSEHCQRALRLADVLAASAKGSIHLVHVVEANPWAYYAAQGVLGEGMVFPTPNGMPLDANSIKAELERELEAMAKAKRGGPCTFEVRTGHAVDEILAAADEQDASLIAICTHGRSGLAHLTIGSVAERVVRYSPIPVLTTRFDVPNA